MSHQTTQQEPHFSWIDLIKSYLSLLGNKKTSYLLWTGIVFVLMFYSLVPPLVLGRFVDFFAAYQQGDSLSPFYSYAVFLGISFMLVSFIRLSVKKKIGEIISQWKVFHMFNGLSYGLCLFIIGHGVVSQIISVGSIVVFYSYFDQLRNAASDVMDFYNRLLQAKAGLGRMMPIFTEDIVSYHGTKRFPRHWKEISVSGGMFHYQNSSEKNDKKMHTLSDIQMTIPRNHKIGFVGETGSGKSTFAKLLAGLHPWDAGRYTIGSHNFYELSHDEVTKYMMLVLQDSEMFNVSLRENITLMNDEQPKLLAKAIQVAHLENVITNLPSGLDTLIGEKGYHLSGGERQRVGIARAIYKDPDILILDEATSALDSKTEQIIQHNLETQLQKKTVISIAHRVSTLRHADSIYVFENGRIVEQGSFDDLRNDTTSRFHEMYEKQSQ